VIIPDVSVLIGAFRRDDPRYALLTEWLAAAVAAPEILALTDELCAAYVRIVTHPKVFPAQTPLDHALAQMSRLRTWPGVTVIGATRRHWATMTQLCLAADVRGGHVSDAHHAAVAIEHGATFVTLDRGFGRFPGLRWRSPLDG
jgi:toxin-antitoxin system PIN domain toxin